MPKANGTRGGIRGNLQGSNAEYFNNLVDSVAMLEEAPVVLDDTAATTLTIATNAGVTSIVPDGTQTNTYSIPTPTVAGQHYHFIYGGAAADAQNVIFRTVTTDNSVYFKGAITHLDTNADNVAVFSNGSSNEQLTITTPQTIDIHCLALNATIWYIWGHACSITVPAFAD